MARFLSDEWLDVLRGAGLSVGEKTVECAVVGAPVGDVKLHAHGDEVGIGGVADADVTLTLPYPEAIAIRAVSWNPASRSCRVA